jgi:carboxymethylenebutenolidase
MNSKMIDIKTTDGICDAYITSPNEDRTYPAAIMYMDAFGIRPSLCEMADRLASHGYFVLLPNLFYRIRRAPVLDVQFPVTPERMPEAVQQFMTILAAFQVGAFLKDAKSFIDFLDNQPHVRSEKIGLTGYCLGGSLALRTGAHFPTRIAALAGFHAGNLATEKPDSPHLLLSQVKAEIYFGHADHDKSLPPEQIERFRQALESSQLHYKVEVYSGAAHGFTMVDLPAGNPAALQRHWDSLIPLFERTLKPVQK